MGNKVRPIAMYLPQYHPIPENDAWWGKGFTEWTNVTKAQPLFENHYQPQLPADLGFYDLRLLETMEKQAKLASAYGIEGFCFYHYWFNGKKLLEQPVNNWLESGTPDFPFMLCWANENWTRRWDGREQDILIEQRHSPKDDIEHIRYLIKFFKDPRYIRVNNKPVFLLYKSFLLPDAAATAKRWREVAAEEGLELYLCHMAFGYNKERAILENGFDAVVDFEPFGIRRDTSMLERKPLNSTGSSRKENLLSKLNIKFERSPAGAKRLNIKEYKDMLFKLKPLADFSFKIFPAVVPGWDNTARKPLDPALILHNNTPELFERWLQLVIKDFKPYSPDENFIFINAWNEWAEGNHLEPCLRWGTKYLESVKSALSEQYRK